jgi:RNA polymerase sigma-70 factor (ECF subfamily)
MKTIPHAPAADDRLLLAALRQGQAKAFEQLMRRYNRLLFRSARGIVRDDAEAQDAVQETYLSAFLALDGFRGDASLATWLTRIVVNQALSQQRKLGRVVLWNEDFSAGGSEMPTDPTSRNESPSPEDEVARLQVRQRLAAAVDALPPIYRSVFMLRAVEGLDVEETALALDVSQDVVKTRFLRARAMLRARLDFDPETEAGALHQFAGHRCDDVVARVLAQLRASGVIRDH